jgi:hypothetical protein
VLELRGPDEEDTLPRRKGVDGICLAGYVWKRSRPWAGLHVQGLVALARGSSWLARSLKNEVP